MVHKWSPAIDAGHVARRALRLLAPGGSVVIPIPENGFWRGESSRRIASVAHQVLGKGCYRLNIRTNPKGVTVTKVAIEV
jgi:hypothetical protein